MNFQDNSICHKCKNGYSQKNGKYSSFMICYTCLEFHRTQYDHSVWCSNPNIITVKRCYDGVTVHAYEQCSSCGFKARGPISKKRLDMSSLLEYNVELQHKLSEEIYAEYHVIQDELDGRKKDFFFSQYAEYLRSSVWQSKRERVLKRDNYLCQACLKNHATEVHHMTYKHVYDEPLFELTSVCKVCHDKITKMDREKEKLFGGEHNGFFN